MELDLVAQLQYSAKSSVETIIENLGIKSKYSEIDRKLDSLSLGNGGIEGAEETEGGERSCTRECISEKMLKCEIK